MHPRLCVSLIVPVLPTLLSNVDGRSLTLMAPPTFSFSAASPIYLSGWLDRRKRLIRPCLKNVVLYVCTRTAAFHQDVLSP